jgi:hypothetical protein
MGGETSEAGPADPSHALRVFISYRREDAPDAAGRLYDALVDRFGSGVFMDVDTIEPGLDFGEVIHDAVGSCDVLVVVIGMEWLTATDATGRRRLDNPEDFVRIEIEAALKRDVRVIPVLLHGASMPAPDELPDSLAKLARRNALEVDHAGWRDDVRRLLQTLERLETEKVRRQADEEAKRRADAEPRPRAGRATDRLSEVETDRPSEAGADVYLSAVSERLASEGFVLTENVSFEATLVRLVATKRGLKFTATGELEYDAALLFEEHTTLDWDPFRDFSSRAARLASQTLGKKQFWCVPVAIVERGDDVFWDKVRTRQPPVHLWWGEFPVVYELRSAALHCFEGDLWWAKGHAGEERELVRRWLLP